MTKLKTSALLLPCTVSLASCLLLAQVQRPGEYPVKHGSWDAGVLDQLDLNTAGVSVLTGGLGVRPRLCMSVADQC
jgi:hypothetical protein